ncbi:MAG: extracellular solute-binding protein [Actinobacteria bacterium]|nr:extracellular solute-binding protein [Actinomycetota bacterium]
MRSGRTTTILLAVIALVAAACGDGGGPAAGPGTVATADLSGTEITMSVSLAEEEQSTVRDVLDQFENQTGATVNLTSVASSDLPEKLRVEVEAGRPTIHLFAQDNLALRVLVDRDLVEPLDDVEIPDGVLESMIPEQFDGTQYFLPFRPNVQVTYVNSERQEAAGVELPHTVDELVSAAQTLREEAGTGVVTLSLAEGDPAAVTLSEFIVSYGGDPLVLNDEGSVAAYETLQRMWQDGLLSEESQLAKFDTQVDYLIGETSWIGKNWPFTSNVLQEQGLLDRFTVYEGWRGPQRAAHVIGGDVLGVPRGVEGQQREAAVELAKFLMSQEIQTQLVAENGWPSVREDALAEVPPELQETFEAVQAALEDGWYRPNVAYWSDVTEAINDGIRRIIFGGEDAQATLDELHDSIAQAAERAGEEYPPSS